MQRYQRSRHRMLWVLILPLAIILIAVAVTNRPQWPRMEALPGLNSNESTARTVE